MSRPIIDFNSLSKNSSTLSESLKLALELEYLEYSFYRTANNTPGLIPAADAAGFKTIEAHEKSQIDFFVKAIADLGGMATTTSSNYDFTKGGVYPVFSDYSTFLMTAQAIEDAGVRAHMALLENLAGHPLYAQVQQIATTEARHAAHSRILRREMHVENVPAEYLVNNFAFQNLKHKSNLSHSHVGIGKI